MPSILPPDPTSMKAFLRCAGPAVSFALFFVLVFRSGLCVSTRRTDQLTLRDELPGARKVVWPIVILACAAVTWLDVSRSQIVARGLT